LSLRSEFVFVSVIMRTEDRRRQTALEDRFRARMFRARARDSSLGVPYQLFAVCDLDFDFDI